MNTGIGKLFRLSMVMVAVAMVWVLSGCGGGKNGAPASPAIQAGHGRLAAEAHFKDRSASRSAAATVSIAISITGYYEEDDSVFPAVTASASGQGKVTVIDVPIGKNHLLTAVATWSDGVTETVRVIIPEVAEGETTTAYADQFSTVVADAAIALAARQDVILSKLTDEEIYKIGTVVGAFLGAGYSYNDIVIDDVLDYDETGSVVTSLEVAPASATVEIDGSIQFTANPKNNFGITISSPSAITWSVSGNIGSISSTGLFTGSSIGEATVTAVSGAISGSAAVTVVETLIPVCGNSVVETGEDCDDGNAVSETCVYGDTSCTVCDSTCASVGGAVSFCGDSTIDSVNNETCDDGNNTTETCAYGEPSCTVCGATCSSVSGETSVCGDGIVDTANEACDDGNSADMDGCSSLCQIETPMYLVGTYVRAEFCAPPTINSGADFFTTKRTIESDGYGFATMTLTEHSQGFATAPRTIPFTNTAGSHSVTANGGRITAFSDDGNVMLRTKTGTVLDSEEPVSVMCLGIGIRENDANSSPLSAANINGTYVAFSIGSSSMGYPWTSREQVVFDGSDTYSSTFLTASFETGGPTTGGYAVDANGAVSLINSTDNSVEATGMVTPDGNVMYLVRTDMSNGDLEVYLSIAFKTSSVYAGPVSNSRYGLYMMGVDSMSGLWVDAEHGIVDVDTNFNAVYNTLIDSNHSLDSSAITITYDPDGQFVTSEGNYGMISPDGSLLLLGDTDLLDSYINMGIGVYSGAAPVAVCGNGHLEVGETCDDANVLDNDGCSALCAIETTLP